MFKNILWNQMVLNVVFDK